MNDPASVGSRGNRLGPWVVVVLSLALAVAYHVRAMQPGAPWLLNLDDGYIHARLGENLARTGVLGINPGSGGGGSSSLLWTLLVAAGAALGLRADLTCGILSFASLGLAVGVTSRLAFDLLPRPCAWVTSIATAVCGQTLAQSLSGMETLLFAGLVIAGLRDARVGRRGDGALLLSLAALVRVEAVLAAVAVAAFSLAPLSRRLLPLASSIIAAAGGISILTVLGRAAPTTLAARRWLFGMGQSLLPGTEQWTGAIPAQLGHLWTRLSGFVGPGGWVGQVWACLVILLLVIGIARWTRSRATAPLALYAVLQLAFVVVVLGDDGQLGRYLAPVWVLAPLLVASGFELAFGRWGRVVATGPLVLLVALYAPQAYRWSGWHRSAVDHLRDVHLVMAQRVAERVPPGQPVAAFDVGLMSYASGHPIVDMGGLAEPGMVEAMWRRDVPRRLEESGVHYVVFPEPRRGANRFAFALRLGFDPSRLGAPVERVMVPGEDLGYLAPTKVAAPALALYEIDGG